MCPRGATGNLLFQGGERLVKAVSRGGNMFAKCGRIGRKLANDLAFASRGVSRSPLFQRIFVIEECLRNAGMAQKDDTGFWRSAVRHGMLHEPRMACAEVCST